MAKRNKKARGKPESLELEKAVLKLIREKNNITEDSHEAQKKANGGVVVPDPPAEAPVKTLKLNELSDCESTDEEGNNEEDDDNQEDDGEEGQDEEKE